MQHSHIVKVTISVNYEIPECETDEEAVARAKEHVKEIMPEEKGWHVDQVKVIGENYNIPAESGSFSAGCSGKEHSDLYTQS